MPNLHVKDDNQTRGWSKCLQGDRVKQKRLADGTRETCVFEREQRRVRSQSKLRVVACSREGENCKTRLEEGLYVGKS